MQTLKSSVRKVTFRQRNQCYRQKATVMLSNVLTERERAETFRKQSEDKWENNCAAKETEAKRHWWCRKWKIENQPIRPTPSPWAPLAQLTHICEHKSISARLLEGLEQKELLFFSRKSCASLPRLMHYALCAVLRDESRKLS